MKTAMGGQDGKNHYRVLPNGQIEVDTAEQAIDLARKLRAAAAQDSPPITVTTIASPATSKPVAEPTVPPTVPPTVESAAPASGSVLASLALRAQEATTALRKARIDARRAEIERDAVRIVAALKAGHHAKPELIQALGDDDAESSLEQRYYVARKILLETGGAFRVGTGGYTRLYLPSQDPLASIETPAPVPPPSPRATALPAREPSSIRTSGPTSGPAPVTPSVGPAVQAPVTPPVRPVASAPVTPSVGPAVLAPVAPTVRPAVLAPVAPTVRPAVLAPVGASVAPTSATKTPRLRSMPDPTKPLSVSPGRARSPNETLARARKLRSTAARLGFDSKAVLAAIEGGARTRTAILCAVENLTVSRLILARKHLIKTGRVREEGRNKHYKLFPIGSSGTDAPAVAPQIKGSDADVRKALAPVLLDLVCSGVHKKAEILHAIAPIKEHVYRACLNDLIEQQILKRTGRCRSQRIVLADEAMPSPPPKASAASPASSQRQIEVASPPPSATDAIKADFEGKGRSAMKLLSGPLSFSAPKPFRIEDALRRVIEEVDDQVVGQHRMTVLPNARFLVRASDGAVLEGRR
ncbi:MAG: hypothetical protein ACHREM_00655 [Polyangiales bacterium]